MLLPLAFFSYMVPLAATTYAVSKFLFFFFWHSFKDYGQRRLNSYSQQAPPKRRALCYKKAASAYADKQHDDGGNLKPV
jgi:hypothetical protein